MASKSCRSDGIGAILATTEVNTGTTHYFSYDGNGNVVNLIDENDNVTASYSYDPFGNRTDSTADDIVDNPYQWSTKLYHEPSGLVAYEYRFYDPNLGRWLNRDPIEETGGKNIYSFVNNRMNNAVDPHGLFLVEVGEVIVAQSARSAMRPGTQNLVGAIVIVSGTTVGFLIMDAGLLLELGETYTDISAANSFSERERRRMRIPKETANLPISKEDLQVRIDEALREKDKTRRRSRLNEMRLQLQSNAKGTDLTYWTSSQFNIPEIGVTVRQVGYDLSLMATEVSTGNDMGVGRLKDDFKNMPEKIKTYLKNNLNSMILEHSKKIRNRVPAGIIGAKTQIKTQRRVDKGCTVRIDSENINGHNLRNR